MCNITESKNDKHKDLIHISFTVGLLLKGIDGLIEIIGAVLLMFLNPSRLSRLTLFLTKHELSEDPKDMVANTLIKISHSFSLSTQQFGTIYLMSHGIFKCVFLVLLWRRKLWAYPLTVFSFVLFIAYQIYRYTFSHSVFLILLSIFDVAMIVLTILEYKRIKIQVAEED